MKEILAIAHRGYCSRYPENTLAAFGGALHWGAHMVELDVHLTRDGHLAVIHDDTVDRTTNGSGLVGDMTLKELKELRCLELDGAVGTEEIPLLEEVLDLMIPRCRVNIEIKNCPMQYDGIERAVAEVIGARDIYDAVIVSSFDHFSLRRIKDVDGRIATGILYSSLWLHLFEEIKALEPYSLHPEVSACQRNQLEEARRQGLKIFPWVAKDGETVRALCGSGLVDGIMVNELELLA